MNNENMNNDFNNVGAPLTPNSTPTQVPSDVQPTMINTAPAAPVMEQQPVMVDPVQSTPVVEPQPVMVDPVQSAPVAEPQPVMMDPVQSTPVVEPQPVMMDPVQSAPVADPQPVMMDPVQSAPAMNPQPAMMDPVQSTPVMNPQPTLTDPTQGAVPANGGEVAPKKKNNMIVIIAIAVVLLACVGGGVFFLLNGSKNEESPAPNPEPVPDPAATQFLTLAGKYVDAVKNLWTSEKMVCQNATNPSEVLKPSALSKVDAYSGPAFYYVFIDSSSSTEMALDVDDPTPVAGWVRIGITDNTYYVALSDGTNYIVDKGTDVNVPFSSLTASDVVTTGNGNNYQYLNGEIFGSNTDGNGWGIGDAKLLTDGDDTNDGIYMSNGKKTAGYTPFCANIKE